MICIWSSLAFIFEHANVLYINIIVFSFAQRGSVDLHSCNIYLVYPCFFYLALGFDLTNLQNSLLIKCIMF